MLLWPDLVVDSSLSRPDVSLGWLDERLTFEELPTDVKNDEDWNIDVRDNEALVVESSDEGIEAIELSHVSIEPKEDFVREYSQ